MSYELMHFRNANQIIKEKKMTKEVKGVMDYLNDCLYGTQHKSELLRQALTEMEWRKNGDLNILEGRRYSYKGFKNRVAIDGSFSSYEYIQDALLRLQVGFDKGKLDMGIVMVTAQRSEKSRLGKTKDLVTSEIEMLHPTISLPVSIVLFDLGRPGEIYQENEPQMEEPQPEELPNHPVIHPDISDAYLHGNKSSDNENHEEASSNAEVKAFHESAKKKKKPRARVKKEDIPELRTAA
jgi:hypothetical protein